MVGRQRRGGVVARGRQGAACTGPGVTVTRECRYGTCQPRPTGSSPDITRNYIHVYMPRPTGAAPWKPGPSTSQTVGWVYVTSGDK